MSASTGRPRRRRRVASAVVTVAVSVVLVLALAPAAGAKHKPKPTTTTTTTWPPLPAFDASLAWRGCSDGFECATLRVPVDWAQPGDTVGLALIRRPATDRAGRLGSLVLNYGGPGESGVDYLRRTWWRLPATVLSRYDVVSFDPRGTGSSRPIDCVDDATLDQSTDLAAVVTTPAQLTALHDYNARFAAGCVARMGAYAGQVGTRNVARDVEAIRVALGEPELDYVGFSYGTVVGATYAQMYPRTVGRMVLDGPPDYWISLRAYASSQAQGFMDALGRFLDWCAQTRCALAASGAPRDVLQRLITRVDEEPMPASYRSGGLTRDGVLTSSLLESAVLSMLYDRARGWPALAGALSEAVVTGHAATLLSLADQYLGRAPDGHWDPLVEANAVISCVDRPAGTAPSALAELADVAALEARLPPWGGSWGTASCIGMPEPAKGDVLGDVRVKGTVTPVLVIGTTGDPATPYAGAQSLVTRIAGSTLLTFVSTEHTAFGRGISACVDDTVVTYLVDGTPPAAGAHCTPD